MNAAPEKLQSVFDRTFAGISQGLGAFTPQFTPREVGTVSYTHLNDYDGKQYKRQPWHNRVR